MKNFSDNIKPVAGILAVKNLNVFPSSGEPDCLDYTKPWGDSFREACRRAGILAAEAFAERSDQKFSLAQLSVPRFEVLGGGRYRLTGGIFLWAGCLFSPGATFRVQANDFHIETPDFIEVATPVPAKMEELKYDTYNAARLNEISDDVLRELGIELDKSKLAFAYLEEGEEGKTWEDLEDEELDGFIDGMSQVKYMSVYAEQLTGGEPGRIIAYRPSSDVSYTSYATPELGFDASYFRELVREWKSDYDQFLVEFVNPKLPFAYIAIEIFGQPAIASKPELANEDFRQIDVFADMFDSTSKDELATHDPAEVVETLRKIGAGEA
jgi:hypothetical protein